MKADLLILDIAQAYGKNESLLTFLIQALLEVALKKIVIIKTILYSFYHAYRESNCIITQYTSANKGRKRPARSSQLCINLYTFQH